MDRFEIAKIVTDKFHESTFVYADSIPMDGEIAVFIYDLNKNSHIITTNSCAGHDKFESNAAYDFVSHPYLAFLVDQWGWSLFWGTVLPEICFECLVSVSMIHEYEKIGIIIRAHYEDKAAFWNAVKPTFLKYFPESQKNV